MEVSLTSWRFVLTLNTPGKISADDIFQKTGFYTSCMSLEETICMKCLSVISGKNKKNIINLSSAEFAQRVVKNKMLTDRQTV